MRAAQNVFVDLPCPLAHIRVCCSFGMIMFGSGSNKGNAYDELLEAVQAEQLVGGSSEASLAKKMQTKIERGQIKLELGGRSCPAAVKALTEDCLAGRVGFVEIKARLRKIRGELEKGWEVKGKVSEEVVQVVEVQSDSSDDEKEKPMKKGAVEMTKVEMFKKKEDEVQAPSSPVKEKKELVISKPRPVVEDMSSSDSDSSSDDSDSDSDISL